MINKKNRWLAAILSVMMVFCYMPSMAFAEGETNTATPAPAETPADTTADTTAPTLVSVKATLGGVEQTATVGTALKAEVNQTVATPMTAKLSEYCTLVDETDGATGAITILGGDITKETPYGTFTVDGDTVTIKPNKGNAELGQAADMTFTVAASQIKDAAGNENEAITFTLDVAKAGTALALKAVNDAKNAAAVQTAIKANAETLGLNLTDYNTLDEGRKLSVSGDLFDSKKTDYTLEKLKLAFNEIVASRHVVQNSVKLVNGASEENPLTDLTFVTMILNDLNGVNNYTMQSGKSINEFLKPTLKASVDNFNALDETQKKTVLLYVSSKDNVFVNEDKVYSSETRILYALGTALQEQALAAVNDASDAVAMQKAIEDNATVLELDLTNYDALDEKKQPSVNIDLLAERPTVGYTAETLQVALNNALTIAATTVATYNGTNYTTLNDAIAAAKDNGGTVKLLQDTETTTPFAAISSNVDIEGQGHTITVSSDFESGGYPGLFTVNRNSGGFITVNNTTIEINKTISHVIANGSLNAVKFTDNTVTMGKDVKFKGMLIFGAGPGSVISNNNVTVNENADANGGFVTVSNGVPNALSAGIKYYSDYKPTESEGTVKIEKNTLSGFFRIIGVDCITTTGLAKTNFVIDRNDFTGSTYDFEIAPSQVEAENSHLKDYTILLDGEENNKFNTEGKVKIVVDNDRDDKNRTLIEDSDLPTFIKTINADGTNIYNIRYTVYKNDGTDTKLVDTTKTLISGKIDDTIEKPDDPTRSGYIFAGWSLDEEGKVPFDFTISDKLSADTNVYAQWIKVHHSSGSSSSATSTTTSTTTGDYTVETKSNGAKLVDIKNPIEEKIVEKVVKDDGSKEVITENGTKIITDADGEQHIDLKLDKSEFPVKSKVYVYYINKDNGKLSKVIGSPFKEDTDGTVLFDAVDTSEYLIESAPEDNVVNEIGSNKFERASKGIHALRTRWDEVENADGFIVYRSTAKNGKYTRIKKITDENTHEYRDGNLKANTHYYYKVVSYVANRVDGKTKMAKKSTDAKRYTTKKA